MSIFADNRLVVAFKEKARAWAQNVVTLVDTPVPPSMESEKQALVGKASKIKKSIESVFGSLDFLDDIGLQGIPILIPLAALAGGVAAVVKWNLDYNKFKDKLAHRNKAIAYHSQLVKDGMTPHEAGAIAEKVYGISAFDLGNKPGVNWGNVLVGMGLLGLSVFALKRD